MRETDHLRRAFRTNAAHRQALLIALSMLLLPALAQTDTLLLRNIETVGLSDAWLQQGNAAALTRYAAPDIATAQVATSHERGGLANYSDPQRQLSADVSAAAFSRLNSRTVVYGAVGYQNMAGKDMAGSAFIAQLPPLTYHLSLLTSHFPRRPFDLVEDSLTNTGNKHQDTYRLTGAVGYRAWREVCIGARLDYTSANYAKYKDLRHKNKLMDLRLSAGVYAPLLPWLGVGADYTYHRQTESVAFSTYGKSEKVYKTLIDYGAFMGRAEQFGNEGFTDKSREMPLFEDGHGGGLQAEVRPTGHLSLMVAARMSHATGYYGRRSPYTITYTGHDRDVTMLTATATYRPAATALHRIDAAFQREKVANRATTFRELRGDNSATYYEYYDPVETGDKWWRDVQVAWTSLLGLQGETPRWQLCAAYQWSRRTQRAYLYPFFRRQRVSVQAVSLSATRNIVGRSGLWTVAVEGGFSQGSGSPYDDYVFTMPDSRQESPATMAAYAWREYQWLCAPQYHVGGAVQYAFVLPHTGMKAHLRLSATHRKANQTYDYSTGCDRTSLSLAVGCTF